MDKPLKPFGDSAQGVWARLAEKLHGAFTDREGWRHDRLTAHCDAWTVTLDIHSDPGYRHETFYTRFRAPYVNPEGFRFNLYPQGFWSGVAHALGGQDVHIGDPEIDHAFVVKTNDEAKIRRLLCTPGLRPLLLQEPAAHLHVHDSNDWFAERFTAGVDELVLEVEGRVVDLPRLERLYALFSETLHALCQLGAAYESEPGMDA